MRRFPYVAACVMLWASNAGAASFDCAKAATPVEQIICDDPELSKMDETLAETISAAMAATLNPRGLQREQRRWFAERDSGATIGDLPKAYRDRLDALAASIEGWRAWPREVTDEQSRKTCVIPPDAPETLKCQVDEAGTIKSAQDRDRRRYQLQSYRDGDRRVGGGVVLFDQVWGRLAPVVAAYEPAVRYARPQLIVSRVATWLLLPGRIEKTGDNNADAVFFHDPYHDSALRSVDIETWQGDVARQLPKGMSARKAIEPNYAEMTAVTPLWRRGDADCCPSGGRAIIRLDLENQRLVVAQLSLERAAPTVARTEEPSPAAAARAAKLEPAAGPRAAADFRTDICGRTVPYEIDEKSFSEGPAANDQKAVDTARTMGPALVQRAFKELCAKTALSPKDIARVNKVVISYADGADVFTASVPAEKAVAGPLIVRMAWMGTAVPADEEARTGILCGFKRKLRQCAGWGPQ